MGRRIQVCILGLLGVLGVSIVSAAEFQMTVQPPGQDFTIPDPEPAAETVDEKAASTTSKNFRPLAGQPQGLSATTPVVVPAKPKEAPPSPALVNAVAKAVVKMAEKSSKSGESSPEAIEVGTSDEVSDLPEVIDYPRKKAEK